MRDNKMNRSLSTDKEYRRWLADIKLKVQQTQIKAAVCVNSELLGFLLASWR